MSKELEQQIKNCEQSIDRILETDINTMSKPYMFIKWMLNEMYISQWNTETEEEVFKTFDNEQFKLRWIAHQYADYKNEQYSKYMKDKHKERPKSGDILSAIRANKAE